MQSSQINSGIGSEREGGEVIRNFVKFVAKVWACFCEKIKKEAVYGVKSVIFREKKMSSVGDMCLEKCFFGGFIRGERVVFLGTSRSVGIFKNVRCVF